MNVWTAVFWFSLFVVAYCYVGYGLLLYCAVRIKRSLFPAQTQDDTAFEPHVTFLVAAYNEGEQLHAKIANTLSLDYPAARLQIVFVTDGSTDHSNEIISRYPQVQLLYVPERKGKTAAINRAMQTVQSPVVIFSDANTLLNKEAIRRLVAPFAKEDTGAVAGEKKVLATGNAATAGEGIYWKYESMLKKWDAELYSVMGAAGELFAIRTELYEAIPENTILDDFVISFNVNRKNYRVEYAPGAYALEHPSASLTDEYKRKVRISAGGFQAIGMQLPILNIARYPHIAWQYISHRVIRWTLAPVCLLLVLVANLALAVLHPDIIYKYILTAQLAFYLAALGGYLLALNGRKVKYLYVPFYFLFMNVAVYHGFTRFVRGSQSAAWERAKRAG